MPSNSPHPLARLAQYRRLREQRDELIREAARMGYSYRRIAAACGMSPSRVAEIVASGNRTP